MAGSKKEYPRDFPKFLAARVDGAETDQEIKASPGILGRVAVVTPRATSSTITLYDGAIGGTQIAGVIDGTQIGPGFTYMIYFETSLHVVTVDSGGNLEVTITYL